MFTGIVEAKSKIINIIPDQENLHFILECALTPEFKIDQSLAHNGCCLTVVNLWPDQMTYEVTAIQETLNKTTLGSWRIGDEINIERSMLMNGRLDGHIVQGHVDGVARCIEKSFEEGSWRFTFTHSLDEVTVEKGSIAVNGVSLTVVNAQPKAFSVCIIPYTYEHTSFNSLSVNDMVNVEFDILGKYAKKILERYDVK
jgi:riboflavin synthase